MGCFGPDSPPPRDYGQETRDTLQAQLDLYPDWISAEEQYGPQNTANTLRNLEQYLVGTPGGEREISTVRNVEGYRNAQTGEIFDTLPEGVLQDPTSGKYFMPSGSVDDVNGMACPNKVAEEERIYLEPYQYQTAGTETVQTPGQRGLLDLYATDIAPRLTEMETEANRARREADIADVSALGLDAYEAMRAANPEQAALMDQLNARAQQDLRLGGRMTPEQQAAIQNSVLGQRSNMGWGYNPGDMAEAARQVSGYSDQLQAQRQQMGMQQAGINQAVYGDPFLQILGRQGQSFAATPGVGQQGMGQQTQQLFNPESAYAGSLYNQNFQTNAMFRAMQPSTMDNIGTGLNMTGQLVGGIGSGMMMCWVAREIYGVNNPRWLQFRRWVQFEAPGWFNRLYALFGPAVARWLRRNGWLARKARPRIKRFMDTKLRVAPAGQCAPRARDQKIPIRMLPLAAAIAADKKRLLKGGNNGNRF